MPPVNDTTASGGGGDGTLITTAPPTQLQLGGTALGSLGISGVVVFGDSLSDNGNFHDLAADFLKQDSGGTPLYSVPFQYDGDGSVRTYSATAFTDGTVYADTLAGLLALETGYENYAFGGAQALGEKRGESYINEYSNLDYTMAGGGAGSFSIVEDTAAALAQYGDFDINLSAQVDRYLAAIPNGAPDGTLAILNIGANDLGEFDTSFFNVLFGGVDAFAEDVGEEVESQSRRLADAGVDAIALYTLPVAEFFLGYGDLNWFERPVARDLLDSVNDEIRDAADRLEADGIVTEVVRVDILAEEILADMQTHGFLYQGPYLFGYSGDPDWVETGDGDIVPVFDVNFTAEAYRPEQILFFDEIHPSGALHDVIAVFSQEVLTTRQIMASSASDTITTTSDDDFIFARDGSDTLTLDTGDDTALGGRGNDTVFAKAGSDLVIGGSGEDDLRGGGGSDLLAGSAGDDHLVGGSAMDFLIGGVGSDAVKGNGGNDVFVFFEQLLWGGSDTSADIYTGGKGIDTLLVFLSPDSAPAQSAQTSGGATVLTFDDGSTLKARGMENILFWSGLPEDSGSPIESLDLNEDLLARYDEGQLWGIV
ncbi:SGNH/GDSL hydrolase family protein [Sulfitobacter sp. D35]|uniref:SGNH/GDSL hydrolase family protein n=1 Tax=Sulfitobacter sp. D35 TaxID=3083252 RepID=UPI00296E6A5B|nr:SGNH/GDSL hydrolase family protein [Sulfitobacter sp. D35]MDW4500501.1 SGNH/GDSL hydrolase family protein [Sulfitobacter sp. D35]